jgi:hypothetical protein
MVFIQGSLSRDLRVTGNSGCRDRAAFLVGRLLLLGELVGEPIMLLFTPFRVRANVASSPSGIEIWTVAGVKKAMGAGLHKMSSYGIDLKNMKSLSSGL